jgi:hypothetical protein
MANSLSTRLGICSESRISCQRGVWGSLRSPMNITYHTLISSGRAWQILYLSCRGMHDAHDWSRRRLGCEPPPDGDWLRWRGVPRAEPWRAWATSARPLQHSAAMCLSWPVLVSPWHPCFHEKSGSFERLILLPPPVSVSLSLVSQTWFTVATVDTRGLFPRKQ